MTMMRSCLQLLLSLLVCATLGSAALDASDPMEVCSVGVCGQPLMQEAVERFDPDGNYRNHDKGEESKDEDGDNEDDASGDSGDSDDFEYCYDEDCLDMGVEQLLDADADLITACEERDEEAWEYLLTLVENPDTPDEIRGVLPRCKNKEEECTLWAVQGKCENDRFVGADNMDESGLDMWTDCAPACFSCDKLLYKNRCPLDHNRHRVWQPGDLNEYFLNLTTMEKYTKYEPKVWSRPSYKEGHDEKSADYQLGPWVVSLDNFLSQEECQRLIELGAEEGYMESDEFGRYLPDGTYHSVVHEGRTSYHAWCEDCHKDPLAKGVEDRLADLTGIPTTYTEPLQLLRYHEGQIYETHHDFDDGELKKQHGVRLMTVFMYLNEVTEGGGTDFPLLNLTFTPKCGRVVVWPNVLNENPDKWDPRTHHQALPPKSTKFSANSWVHQHDVRGPFSRNCRD